MPTPTHWLAEAELPQLCTDAQACDWLRERGSLTERLRRAWGDVAVQPLQEAHTPPLPHEAARLNLAPGEAVWLRCVQLVCRGQPRLYARTVIPAWGPHNPWAEVQRLGQQPLGELLFRLPDLQRSGFEWAHGARWPHTVRDAAPARRCVFVRQGAPLLLTEVFLDLAPHTDTHLAPCP